MHSRWNMHTHIHACAHTHTASVTDLLSSRWQFHTRRRRVKPSPADIFSRWKYFFNQMCLIVWFFLRCTSCSLISTQTALNVLSSAQSWVFCCSSRLRAENHCAFTVSEPPAHFSNIVHHNRSTGRDSNFIYFCLVFIFLSYLTCSGHPANLLTFYILPNLISYTCLFWPCFTMLGF